MFLGYQNNIIAFVKETREELENLPYIKLDRIEETNDDVEMIDGVYYLGKESIKEAKQKKVREYRNYLLETELDPIVSNPLRWEEISEFEKIYYRNYRKYLLDYTEQENWWESKPKTYEDFYTEDVVVDKIEDIIPVDVDEE